MFEFDSFAVVTLIIVGLITAFLRFAPFIIFGRKEDTPELIIYLGSILPYAIMGMLVIFCLRNVSITNFPHGLPELIAIAVTALVHVLFKKTLVSVISGTACYMILIQAVCI